MLLHRLTQRNDAAGRLVSAEVSAGAPSHLYCVTMPAAAVFDLY